MTKLTLSVPDKDIVLARKRAKTRGTSISAMFSEWLHAETPENAKHNKIGPLTRSISGIISLPDDFDEKEAMSEILSEKYGLK
ncbi:MAG: hypothetical protein A2020_00250 [Lentisphaerae bacterium GWF2_45_14]|nr:MAG: hypothetical protein A2020_00250 [Lentisphaerae bacterium GWF2_45_14]